MTTAKAGAFDVEWLEAGSGPAVILVHSSASGHRQWRRLIDDLKGRYRCVAVNLFGYGSTSPWPADRRQSLADQAELVAAVVADLGEPVILVGHSLGGAVSLEAAFRLRERLRAVVAFEPILFSLLKTHGPAAAFAEILDIASRYRVLGAIEKWDEAGEMFVDYWSGAGSWSAMSEERKIGLRVMLPNVAHEWDAVIDAGRSLSDWGGISAPVHIMRAADTRRPTHAIASLLTGTHRHWRLHEVSAGGHMAPVARPDLVNPPLAEILAELSGPART